MVRETVRKRNNNNNGSYAYKNTQSGKECSEFVIFQGCESTFKEVPDH